MLLLVNLYIRFNHTLLDTGRDGNWAASLIVDETLVAPGLAMVEATCIPMQMLD